MLGRTITRLQRPATSAILATSTSAPGLIRLVTVPGRAGNLTNEISQLFERGGVGIELAIVDDLLDAHGDVPFPLRRKVGRSHTIPCTNIDLFDRVP